MTVSSLLRAYRGRYLTIWSHSFFIALLALTPFIYLMQVHERVYASRSWDTLGFITAAVVFAMLVWTALKYYRERALQAIGHTIDERLRTEVFDAVHRSGEKDAFRAYVDIGTFRQGVTGSFVGNLLDASLAPIFIAVLYLLHPVFGWMAILYLLAIGLLSYVSRRIWKGIRADAKPLEDRAFGFGIATAAKSQTIRAMHLLPGVRRKWATLQDEATEIYMDGQRRAGLPDAALNLLEKAKIVIVIGVAAVLYLQDLVSASTGLAAFIIMMRGLGPVFSVARSWHVVQETRDAMGRIDALLERYAVTEKAPLPYFEGQLSCEGVGIVTPGGKSLLNGVQFSVPSGCILGVVGPSGAGKSTLLSLLSGGMAANRGTLKLGGFPIDQWPVEQLGPAIGYLPQGVDLLPGTIRDNVSRFAPATEETNAKVLEALRMAGALEFVQSRDVGLDFELAMDGAPLSGGQKQRIGLARAFYDMPKLVVLDEPSSALDAAGERTLAFSVAEIKRAGGTVVFSTHKAGLLDICDYILVIMDGYQHSFSTKEDMMNRFRLSGNQGLRIVAGSDTEDDVTEGDAAQEQAS